MGHQSFLGSGFMVLRKMFTEAFQHLGGLLKKSRDIEKRLLGGKTC
jgi:hypothetical protein